MCISITAYIYTYISAHRRIYINGCLETVLLTCNAFLFFTMRKALQVLKHFSLATMCVS